MPVLQPAGVEAARDGRRACPSMVACSPIAMVDASSTSWLNALDASVRRGLWGVMIAAESSSLAAEQRPGGQNYLASMVLGEVAVDPVPPPGDVAPVAGVWLMNQPVTARHPADTHGCFVWRRGVRHALLAQRGRPEGRWLSADDWQNLAQVRKVPAIKPGSQPAAGRVGQRRCVP